MKLNYLFKVLLFFLITITSSYGQYASKHYIAPAPWKYWNQANEIVIGTKTPNQTVNVTLSKSDGTFITTLQVTENNPISYRFEGTVTGSTYNPLNTVITDIGIIVEATAPVMVNLRNIASDVAGSTISNIKGNASLVSFGGEGLGLDFLVGYYRTSSVGLAMPGVSSTSAPVYSIMATEDTTTVTLPTGNITLNEGESYLFTAPLGSLITADKLVVMNTGSYGDTPQTCGANGQDGTFDQIAPVHSLGTQYLVVRGQGTAPTASQATLLYGSEQTVIIASQPNTTITITTYSATGVQLNTSTTTLAAVGDYHTFYHGDGQNAYSSSLITSTAPVVVYSGTAVTCETDISTVLPIGGCSGALNVQTKKFINYNNGNLPYFGFSIIESATEPVLINGVNLETQTGNTRIPLGTSGFYLLMFNNINLGNPANIILTSDLPLTSSLVQQGDGFSMSAFFSSFGELAEPPVVGFVNNDCSVTLTAESGYTEYKWYKNGALFQTTTQNTITITESGNYSVQYLKDCGYSGISVPTAITVEPCADLSIKKELINEGVNQVTFQLTVTNLNQYFVSENVIVTDLLPGGYSYISSNATQGTYNATTGIWTIGDLNPLQTVVLTMVCSINPIDQYNNVANVSSDTPDTNDSNNSDHAGISKTVADVDAIKDDGIEFYKPGQEIVYTITIKNNGPSYATNINVSDPMPQGITTATWTSTQNTNGVGNLVDLIPLLHPNEQVVYTVTMEVPKSYRGDLVNVVSYDSDYYNDPNEPCTRCTDIDHQFPEFPKGISPNGDGKNDFLDLSNFFIAKLQIFNRYGKVVYSKEMYKDEWKGQSDAGEMLPSGTYFYHARSASNQEFTGYIELNY